MQRARVLSILLFVSLVVALTGCDLATKQVAHSTLREGGPLRVVAGFFDLRYTENRDVAFSALRVIPASVRRPLILVVNLGVLVLLTGIWWRRRDESTRLEQIALAVMFAGGLGNTADRLLRGFVVDFIHVHRWPIFNVADVLLAVGAGLLVIAWWRKGETLKPAS